VPLTVLLGIYFTILQAYEYTKASFTIADSTFFVDPADSANQCPWHSVEIIPTDRHGQPFTDLLQATDHPLNKPWRQRRKLNQFLVLHCNRLHSSLVHRKLRRHTAARACLESEMQGAVRRACRSVTYRESCIAATVRFCRSSHVTP
jgi:hypothetical protein